MLLGLSPLLTADLLHLLASMGHGDEVVIVDANFPAASTAAASGARLVHCPGLSTPDILKAVLTVLPLDRSVSHAAAVMVPEPAHAAQFKDGMPEAAAEIRAVVAATGFATENIARFAFYERARKSYGLVQSGERRVYGNVILKKGVVAAP